MVHILLSVGLLGAIACFFVLVLAGLEGPAASGAFKAAEQVSTYVILPVALAGLGMGVLQALTTSWGLAKHYWVLVKALLTSVAVVVFLVKRPMIHALATIAAGEEQRLAAMQLLLHAAGGFCLLLVVLWLSILKPKGRTGLGD